MSLFTWHANGTAPCNKNSAHECARTAAVAAVKGFAL